MKAWNITSTHQSERTSVSFIATNTKRWIRNEPWKRIDQENGREEKPLFSATFWKRERARASDSRLFCKSTLTPFFHRKSGPIERARSAAVQRLISVQCQRVRTCDAGAPLRCRPGPWRGAAAGVTRGDNTCGRHRAPHSTGDPSPLTPRRGLAVTRFEARNIAAIDASRCAAVVFAPFVRFVYVFDCVRIGNCFFLGYRAVGGRTASV